jgi:hypothetical protein
VTWPSPSAARPSPLKAYLLRTPWIWCGQWKDQDEFGEKEGREIYRSSNVALNAK